MARGTIRQRSKIRKDSWTVQVYTGVDPKTGKKRYYSEAVKGTKTLAQRRLTELLRETDTGTFVEPSRLTVAEYLKQWLQNSCKGRVSNRTLEGYKGNLDRYLIPRIGTIPLEKLTPKHVQEMVSELLSTGGYKGKPLSPRTVLQVHRVLSKSLNDAVKLGIVVRNVVVAVEPPRVTKYEAHVLSWNEVHDFLEQISDPLYLTLVLLDIQTGLRRSELLGLQWRDVNLSTGILSVKRALIKLPSGEAELTVPKSGRGRVVALPVESVESLQVHREHSSQRSGNGDFVFCHSDGSHLNPDVVTKWFRRVADRNGFKQIRLHDLRHTHASLMLAKGIHVKIVSERLGHSGIGITGDLYSHVLPSVQEEAVSRFEAEWRKGMAKECQIADSGQ